MTPHEKILTAATAMVVLVAVIGFLFHWYVCAVEWWPLVGREWREQQRWERERPVVEAEEDWADELHAINQLGKPGDLTRPVAQLTHYEVEAVIRTLGVPEWVPQRYLAAA